jgi:hypothetical protein
MNVNPIQNYSVMSDMTKRVELMQIALALEMLATSSPSTVVSISQAAIDKLAQDVGSL